MIVAMTALAYTAHRGARGTPIRGACGVIRVNGEDQTFVVESVEVFPASASRWDAARLADPVWRI